MNRMRRPKAIESRYPFLLDSDKVYLRDVASRVLAKSANTISYGVFAGTFIPSDHYLATRPIWPVGCYEIELEETLKDVISNPPSTFIDIGSAFGYYTVGIALNTLRTNIIGFEADQEHHWEQAKYLASVNGVDSRITQKGFCSAEQLSEENLSDSVILCDCEGAENDILDPLKVPSLLEAKIICEVHNFIRPGTSSLLIDRFKRTHAIQIIFDMPRNPSQFRVLDGFDEVDKYLSVTETKHIPGRITDCRFLVMTPRAEP